MKIYQGERVKRIDETVRELEKVHGLGHKGPIEERLARVLKAAEGAKPAEGLANGRCPHDRHLGTFCENCSRARG